MGMKKGIAVLLVLLVALSITSAIAGCGTPSPQEAQARLKTDLQSLQDALAELLNPATYASTDSFNTAADNIKKAFNDVVASAKQVKNIKTADLESAWDDLKKAISSDQPLTDKLIAIQAAAKEFQAAWQELYSSLKTSQ